MCWCIGLGIFQGPRGQISYIEGPRGGSLTLIAEHWLHFKQDSFNLFLGCPSVSISHSWVPKGPRYAIAPLPPEKLTDTYAMQNVVVWKSKTGKYVYHLHV